MAKLKVTQVRSTIGMQEGSDSNLGSWVLRRLEMKRFITIPRKYMWDDRKLSILFRRGAGCLREVNALRLDK